tara:strand:- start:133 stop:324 length:192 start_codon:yes stop_codon:yes gene_type:complete
MLVVEEVEKDVVQVVLLDLVELVVVVKDQKIIALLEKQELRILVGELVVVVYFHQDQQVVQEL